MQISQTAEQIQALSALQQHCEIKEISLASCTASRPKAGAQFRAPYSARPVLSNVSPSQRGDLLTVEVSFEYSAWDSSEPSERLFIVNCSFEVSYQVTNDHAPTEEELASFARGTAVFNCWPYAREFLRDITSRLGHPTPVLPLLRIVPKKADGPPTIDATAKEIEPGTQE